jgi:hypothetical protein
VKIEEVRLKVNLKGNQYWEKGLVVKAPIPAELLQEVKLNTGTVEVLKYAKEEPIPAPVSEPVPELKVKKLIKRKGK